MKKQTIKLLLAGICVLAAGICYSCSRQTGRQEEYGLILEPVPFSLSGECLEYETAADSEPETDAEPAVSFTEPQFFYVHICGEVRNPGVYQMEPGERIFQAVERAGGFTEAAAEGYLNLALEVKDGMKIVVPSREEERDSEENGGSEQERNPESREQTEPGIYLPEEPGEGSGSAGNEKINLNTATKEELMTLKGIGQARAEDIIRYRQEHGAFQAIEEIMNVSGIKEGAFQKIKEDITV